MRSRGGRRLDSRALTCVLAIAAAALSACGSAQTRESRARDAAAEARADASPDARALADAIEALPEWNRTNYAPPAARAQLERVAADAARLDLATVRVAVGLVDRAKGEPVIPARLAAWGRLTLFNRAYFAVPSAVPPEQVLFFAGWITADRREGAPDGLLWPLVVEDGRIVAVRGFNGYMGAGYDAVGEFDYFAANFGLRYGRQRGR
jgi:hypothetical protein